MTPASPIGLLSKLLRRAKLSFNYRVGRLQSLVLCELKERTLSRIDRERQQVGNFLSRGLDRNAGIVAINGALRDSGFGSFSEDDDMFSEHLVLLAALSATLPEARNVMEIGTYDGRTALILSHLFPRATITTIDLPRTDPVYLSSYEVARTRQFIDKRNEVLRRNPRLKFIEANSLSLTIDPSSAGFDVVWVDGDHDFPVVGIDLANAVRLLRSGGHLLCDDVVTAKASRSTTYLSDASHRSLVALHGAGLIDEPTYFYKRLGKHHQHPRKFVAIARTRTATRA
ncbi:MAG: class I SAM-dependent methyltransferase [Actinobacteria bacterium]|nr:class I SAM-dependent methyltransferase [Actinomycetota bacterium]